MDNDEQDEVIEAEVTEVVPWTNPTGQGKAVIETGRGAAVEVAIGTNFVAAITEVARQHNYGGLFRVFLNGEELLSVREAPQTIQPGMRIALTPYDKVGQLA